MEFQQSVQIDASLNQNALTVQKLSMLVKVILPQGHTTLVQVTEDNTVEDLLLMVCQRKVLVATDFDVLIKSPLSDIETIAPLDSQFISYGVKEIRLQDKRNQSTANGNSDSQASTPISKGRRQSQIRLVKHEGAPMAAIEVPQSVMTKVDDQSTDKGDKSKRKSNPLQSLAQIFKDKKFGISVSNSSASILPIVERPDVVVVADVPDKQPVSHQSSRVSDDLLDHDVAESFTTSKPGSTISDSRSHVPADSVDDFVDMYDDVSQMTPTSPGPVSPVVFDRKRAQSTGRASQSTLRRSQLRTPSIQSQSSDSDPAGQPQSPNASREFILLRVRLDAEFTTIKLPSSATLEDVLLKAIERFTAMKNEDDKLQVEEYTLANVDGSKLEMDRSIGYVKQQYNVQEIQLIKAEKCYSTMCMYEDGKEVMILQNNNGTMQVMAATQEKLIEYATDDTMSTCESEFSDILLMAFRSFMKPADFFDCLIARFNAELPPDPTQEEVEYYNKTKVVLQQRVVAIMQWWVKYHWHDFATNPDLKLDLEEFIDALQTNESYANAVHEFRQIIEDQTDREEQIQDQRLKIMKSNRKTMESMFEEIDPTVLAEQMCIYNFQWFCHIHPIEFLNQIWRKKEDEPEIWATPNLDFFSGCFNRESYWVATELVNQKDLKKRVNILKKFIALSKASMEKQNYFSMFSIYVGLNLGPVQRLKKTWDQLPAKVRQTYDEVEKACDPSRNMKAYREMLSAAAPPIIPFIPIYLKDLTFMQDGNEKYFKGLLNFEKLRMMANRVKEIQKLTNTPFTYEPVPAIQNYLTKPPIEMNLAKLKEESLKCESND
ncbi:hypothetical protein MIR68_002502 [Amoeboaphelidium protococcarum]|nr:hypothetical protein MIR68_002502 [Amoeboaphelidium protococcarum]